MQNVLFEPKKGMRGTIRSLAAGMNKKTALADWGTLGKVFREARDGYIPFEFQSIALGIDYALNTGRLHARAEIALRQLKPQELGKLMCDLYYEGSIMQGDIPAAINRRFENENI